MTVKTAKATQRERLLAGMIAATNRDGYARATVSQVIAHAGVSRPTFYDYFVNKDDCFIETHRDIAGRLVEQIRDAVEQAPPEQALQAGIRRLCERAEAEPEEAQFMANEALAGGPRALDERDGTIGQIEEIIERARGESPPGALSPDLPTRVLIGATHWLLSPRLRRGEHDLTRLAEDVIEWIESYNLPSCEHRWRTLEPGPSPGPSRHVSELPLSPPPPRRPGRTRLPAAEAQQNQRLRILFATAETATHKGYAATTVADIAAAARMDKRVFYNHFRDKQQAFLAVHELAFQQTMAIAAGAFFSTDSWAERMWQAIHAASQFNATHPIAYVIYLESHAVGAPAIQRVEERHVAFTIFMQEGNQHAANQQTRTAMEAIVAAGFEVGYNQFRQGVAHQLLNHAYLVTYMCLAPFLGLKTTNDFLDRKLEEGSRP
jgi:AcrR family transcriptional regulator